MIFLRSFLPPEWFLQTSSWSCQNFSYSSSSITQAEAEKTGCHQREFIVPCCLGQGDLLRQWKVHACQMSPRRHCSKLSLLPACFLWGVLSYSSRLQYIIGLGNSKQELQIASPITFKAKKQRKINACIFPHFCLTQFFHFHTVWGLLPKEWSYSLWAGSSQINLRQYWRNTHESYW